MGGLRYLARRLAMAVVVVVAVSILTFLVVRIVPSDPAALFAGPRPTQGQIAEARDRLGLGRPLPAQYLAFAGRVLHGDFGVSFKTRRPIISDIGTFLPATLELVIASTILSLLIGVPVGALAGAKPGGWIDQASRFVAIAGVSVPTFWLAMILQLFFFRQLGWLPLSGRLAQEASLFNPITSITGLNTFDALLTGNWKGFIDAVWHLILPAVTLAAYPIGLTTRMMRAGMIETMQEKHVLAARALGLSERFILFRYALKVAFAPNLTVLGLSFAYSLTGAFLVEVIFSWPGLGRYVTDAILNVDFPVIMAVTLVVTVFYVAINLAVDLLHALLDPRIVLL
jgi:peptide/nickel transport system permease protein